MAALPSQSDLQFTGAAWPTNEIERIAALVGHQILDTPPEATFDQITKAAADLLGTPVSLISLLDESRQWVKSSYGSEIEMLPRDISLCQYTILQPEALLVINDTLADERVANHPMVVGPPHVRFYAGVALTTPAGYAIGTLCSIGLQPHELTRSQRDGLRQLGKVTEALLEQRLSDAVSPLLNRAIEQKLGVGIVISDANSRKHSVIYCNPSFERLSGFSNAEVVGKSMLSVCGNEDQSKLRFALTSKNEQQLTVKGAHKSGEASWLEVTVSPIFDAKGNIARHLTIYRDVTRQYMAEMRSSEFGAMLEESLNEIYIVDGATYKFIQVNKGARRNLGYDIKELIEMSPLDISDEKTREKIRLASPSMIDGTRDKVVYHGLNRRKDGSYYDVEVHVQHMHLNGRPVFLAVALDITARKNAERSLQKAHEELEQRVVERTAELKQMKELAEHANEGKTRFLSAASHDLRQPLQALQLYLSTLAMRLENPKSKQLSEKMQLSLTSINGLLDSLLNISALETGAVKPDMQNVELKGIIDRVINIGKQQAKGKGLDFECETSPIWIHTDPGLFERILANFIGNAVRYTESGKISIACDRHADSVRISVTDTGIGIADKKLETIFDEYVQLNKASTARRRGLGLGLSIVKYISELLEHPISVSSVAGRGSTFSVDVPIGQALSSAQQASVGDTNEPSPVLSKPRVLMVDDDPDVMDAMVELISSFNIELHTANSPSAALDMIANGLRPDLLISDFQMPGMNGLDLTREIRRQLQEDLPVIVMTGDLSTTKIDEARLSNCSAFLKPISVEQLMPLIHATPVNTDNSH